MRDDVLHGGVDVDCLLHEETGDEAQREMAIDKAKTIEGVKDVSADGLKAVD